MNTSRINICAQHQPVRSRGLGHVPGGPRLSRIRTAILALSVLAAPAALGACAGAGESVGSDVGDAASSSGAPVEVRFTLTEFAIQAEETTFRTGVPYRFVIENEGVIAHDFRITARGEAEAMAGAHVPGETHAHGTELMLVHEADLPPGATHTEEITFLRPGDFEIACHVAGHLQAGMHIPITIEGDVLAEATPIDPASITYDPDAMPDMPCHAMGITIMGDCTEEDVERLKAEILEGAAGGMGEMMPGEMGAMPGEMGEMPEGMMDGDHAHGDEAMPGGMMSEDAMSGMMGNMMGGEMMENMMGSGEMAQWMQQRILFDLSSRRDEACQVVEPNTIIGACTPEEVARLVGEIMATIDQAPDEAHEDEGSGEDGDHGHDDSSGEG